MFAASSVAAGNRTHWHVDTLCETRALTNGFRLDSAGVVDINALVGPTISAQHPVSIFILLSAQVIVTLLYNRTPLRRTRRHDIQGFAIDSVGLLHSNECLELPHDLK